MNIIQKKKGVSEVVSVVLIIMITVAAIAVLWTVVIPMIRDNTTSGAACFKAASALSIVDDQYTCFKNNVTGNYTSVKVAKSSSEANVSYAQIIIYFADGSSDSKVEDIRAKSANTENTYIYNVATKSAVAVAVAPVLTTGKTNTTCTVSPKVALVTC